MERTARTRTAGVVEYSVFCVESLRFTITYGTSDEPAHLCRDCKVYSIPEFASSAIMLVCRK